MVIRSHDYAVDALAHVATNKSILFTTKYKNRRERELRTLVFYLGYVGIYSGRQPHLLSYGIQKSVTSDA